VPQITFLWLSLTYNPRRIGLILRLTSNGGSVSDPLFGAMRQSVIDGAPDKAAELAQQALDSGVDPLEAVNHGFAAGITFAGDQFGCGQMFLPDLLASAEAMQAAMKILEPEMLKRGSERETLGKVVLARPRRYPRHRQKPGRDDSFRQRLPDLRPRHQRDARAIRRQGTRDRCRYCRRLRLADHDHGRTESRDRSPGPQWYAPRVKAIIGGAAITQKWAAEIGADGYSRNAIDALELAKNLMGKGTAAA